MPSAFDPLPCAVSLTGLLTKTGFTHLDLSIAPPGLDVGNLAPSHQGAQGRHGDCSAPGCNSAATDHRSRPDPRTSLATIVIGTATRSSPGGLQWVTAPGVGERVATRCGEDVTVCCTNTTTRCDRPWMPGRKERRPSATTRAPLLFLSSGSNATSAPQIQRRNAECVATSRVSAQRGQSSAGQPPPARRWSPDRGSDSEEVRYA
jgi:hypothetical protein